MGSLRIHNVAPLHGFRLQLMLSDGSIIERDLSALVVGPVFEPLRADRALFAQARVEGGIVVWPNGADLCPDVLIWNGPPPKQTYQLLCKNPPAQQVPCRITIEATIVSS
jgi:hypothetical protein